MDKHIRKELVKQLSISAYDHSRTPCWGTASVIAAEPGWRVVVQTDGDDDNPHGAVFIRSICVWMINSIGGFEPAYFDTFAPQLARAAGRIIAILPPGTCEPLKSGADEQIDLTGEPVSELRQ